MPEQQETKPTTNLTERAVTLVLTRKYLGSSKSVRSDRVRVVREAGEADTDSQWLGVSKLLLAAPELAAIYSLDEALASQLTYYCLPSLFKRSMYLLPLKLVTQVDAMLTKHREARQVLVDAFLARYGDIIVEAQTRLGSLFNEADYAPPAKAKAAFKFEWEYLQFGVSEGLKRISVEMFAREQDKAAEKWKETNDLLRQVLRGAMAEMVSHMVERLTPKEDGTKKIFRASKLKDMQDFMTTFDARNLTDDAELQAVVEKARALTEGLDVELLRSDEKLRTTVQQGFTDIKTALDPMIVDAPSRRIQLED